MKGRWPVSAVARFLSVTRFLALGDSYTVGEGVAPAESWPLQLAARLKLEPTVVATSGWTSGELLAALDADPPNGPYEVVSLCIGVNDQFRGLPLDGYTDNLAALLDRAIGLATIAVFAVSIPDWGVTPYAADRDRAQVGGAIDQFNLALGELAQSRGITCVDVTPASREMYSEVVEDGLHPSATQYRAWTQLMAPVVERLLEGGVPA